MPKTLTGHNTSLESSTLNLTFFFNKNSIKLNKLFQKRGCVCATKWKFPWVMGYAIFVNKINEIWQTWNSCKTKYLPWSSKVAEIFATQLYRNLLFDNIFLKFNAFKKKKLVFTGYLVGKMQNQYCICDLCIPIV